MAPDGTLVAGRGVVSSSRFDTGLPGEFVYGVTFTRSIIGCIFVGTVNGPAPGRPAFVFARQDFVDIGTYDLSSPPQNEALGFRLRMVC